LVVELTSPVAGVATRGILVAAVQGVPVAEPSVAERAVDASTLLAAPVIVIVGVVVVVAVAVVAVSPIPVVALPTQPMTTIQPVCHPGQSEHAHLHSLLLRLLLIWVE
jgi:hypothetical protein